METIEHPRLMHAWADRVRAAGLRIGFVPTMGYLHDGHLSLVREARQRADRCVVSIFVNPLQFGPSEDFDRYPCAPERDAALLREAGVDVLYRPTAGAMYPEGFQTQVAVAEVTKGLCGRSRPGHFAGVTTVVAKLFNAVKPHVAVFGEKDYQQLAAIRRMVADLDLDVAVVAGPTVREADGLAMSSRNANLNADEREAARCLSRGLRAAQQAIAGGERRAARIVERAREIVAAESLAGIDYIELVDAATLRPVDDIRRPTVLAMAARIGRTRLIDNVILPGRELEG